MASHNCNIKASFFNARIVSLTFGQHFHHPMLKHASIPFLGIFLLSTSLSAQTFEDRRQQYIDSALTNFDADAIVIQAYEGLTVDQPSLDAIYNVMTTRSTIDFAIVQLVRVMMLSNGAYDSQIIPQLNLVPYWINNYDTIRSRWSENHLSMWMGSDWLIHEYTGRPIDPTLEQRLKHYLQLKIDYGYYEYFSSTYAPYALSGLLNLADFAQDQEVRNLAIAASKRLLRDLLLPTNELGVFFPSAGRNYPSKYESAYGENHSSLIWLLTGRGPAPSKATHAGAFLATTSVDYTDVANTWVAELDTVVSLGHTLQEGFVINQSLTDIDRTVFQWSSGAYFHPEVILETVTLLKDSNMWNHVDFELISDLQGFPLETYPGLAEGLSGVSKSSVNCGVDVAIFKNGPVTLCSTQDLWKGKVGYQQWPICASSGTSAIYTGSGPVEADWQDRPSTNANEHLPYVEQSHNVALVMYRPEPLLPVVPFNNKDVALHWKDADFDEIVEDGNWIIGREDNGYVAVRRHCVGEINTQRACETDAGQAWAFVVGNDAMYGSFSSFQNLISQSQFEEEWLVTLAGDSTYHASVQFDTTFIEYYWDPLEFVGIEEATDNGSFLMWPNPATETLTVDLSEFEKSATISVVNNLGQVIYFERISSQNQFTLPVSNWSDGIYSVILRDEKKVATQRLVKR